MFNCLILITYSGLTFDPVIYVFMTKHYRNVIVGRFCTCRQQVAILHNIPLEHVNNVETSGRTQGVETQPQAQPRCAIVESTREVSATTTL